MALQSSGAISLLDVQTEFGGTNPISISEYYGSGTVPASGTIALSDFYGQTAFGATWSGSSDTQYLGISTSGSQYRIQAYDFFSGTVFGGWLTVNSDGTFENGVSTAIKAFGEYVELYGGGHTSQSTTAANEFRYYESTGRTIVGAVAFTITGGFTGSSLYNNELGWATSGGLVRAVTATDVGVWISLT